MITTEEFKAEIAEYASSSYEDFRRYQRLTSETLAEVDRVARIAGVDYQLAWGSLLGAVRDGGQIPWDYDIDLFVPIDQRQLLVDGLRRHLDGRYYVSSIEFDEECDNYLMRVCPKGYDSSYMHVDIFFLCGAPCSRRKSFDRSFYILCRTRYWKYADVEKRARGNNLKRACFNLFHALSSCVPNSALDRRYWSLANRVPLSTAQEIVEADRFSRDYTFPRSILDTEDIVLGDGSVRRVPKERDELLRRMYGEYMLYAPTESRFREFLSHYWALKSSL